ncbi:MAG: TonB-dependent receptor, partial [Gemmatimonadaceae bacterium]|nr:TonB-dependent receptor [Chitinophagaceae bacterium]
SGNFNYRKNKLALNLTLGSGYNIFNGEGYSKRENVYADSTNYFNTTSQYRNTSTRPNARFNLDYELNKQNAFNILLQYNQNNFNNRSGNTFLNMNRFMIMTRSSRRAVRTEGQSINPNLNFTWTHKGLKSGDVLRVITGYNYSYNQNDRYFFQEFLNADDTPNGIDSTQQLLNDTWNNGLSIRVNYDKPLRNKKTHVSVGTYYNRNNSHVLLNNYYLKKPEGNFLKNELYSNDFVFHQSITNYRASLKQLVGAGLSFTAGASAELTAFGFDLTKNAQTVKNSYWTFLPFANFNKNWNNRLNLTFSYRRSIRRPGVGELNPTVDNGDPYNLRFGNPDLEPSKSHNFDLVIGKTKDKFYVNAGVGFNRVEDIYQQLRTLLADGKTQTTWYNISNRSEYEVSTWSGLTLSRKLRMNFSATYSYNSYSLFDRTKNKYRNGGTITSNLNSNYTPTDLMSVITSFTFNRFANPQGTVRSNVSMNLGIQHRFLSKKLIVTVNAIDPFISQKNKVFTYGPNFNLESYNSTQTRNFRLTVGYSITKKAKKLKR